MVLYTGAAILTVETRFDNDSLEYVAMVVNANAHPETRRFKTLNEFRAWLVSLEQELRAEQWKADGPPRFLADGWPNRRPES